MEINVGYHTEVSRNAVGNFLVQRFFYNKLVDRYTTADLSQKRRDFKPWMQVLVDAAGTPLGETALGIPSFPVPVHQPSIFERLEAKEKETEILTASLILASSTLDLLQPHVVCQDCGDEMTQCSACYERSKALPAVSDQSEVPGPAAEER